MEKDHHATVPPVGVTFSPTGSSFTLPGIARAYLAFQLFAVFASWMLGASRRDETILLLLLLLLTEREKKVGPLGNRVNWNSGEDRGGAQPQCHDVEQRVRAMGGTSLLACQACQLTPANKGPDVGRHSTSIGDEVIHHWCWCLGQASQRPGEDRSLG